MRRSLPIVSLAGIVTLAVLAAVLDEESAKADRAAPPKFTAQQLTAPPTDGWITNGGNVYNQRYSPLKQHQPGQRRDAEAGLAHAPERLGHGQQVLGPSAADRLRRRHLHSDRRQRRVRARRRHRRDPLDARGEPRSEHHRHLLRLALPRRRDRRRQGVLRSARRQARRARSRDGQGRVVHPGGDEPGRLQHHDRAALLRRPRDHGLRGRRPREPRPREGLRRTATASSSGRSIRFRVPANSATTRGRATTTRGSTAARPSGRRRPSIPSSGSSTSRPATPAPI